MVHRFRMVPSFFMDQGDGFLLDSDNNMEVTIKFTGLNYTAYDEEYNVKFPVDKYLNIPVGHLKKGDYKVDVKIKDKRGNTGSFLIPEIAKFKVDRKKFPEEYKLLNPSGNDIELKFSDTGKDGTINCTPAELSWINLIK